MRNEKLIYFIAICLLGMVAACGQQKHDRKKRQIEKQRAMKESVTAHLSGAVAATDQAAWDSTAAFKQFYDTANAQLIASKQKLSDFKTKVSTGHKKVPMRYRAYLSHLEDRIAELEARLATYNHTGKATWEDFTTLFNCDMNHLDKQIDKLVKKETEKIGQQKGD